jgi:flagellar basal body-associated protein FliL
VSGYKSPVLPVIFTQKIKGAMVLEGKGSFFILLVIVAILTLTLAVLAGYLFFVSGTPKTTTEVSAHETENKPKEEELGHHTLFEGKQYFNLKSVEEEKVSIIMLGIQIDYLKSKDTEADEEKFVAFGGKIKEVIGTYFQNMTLEDAKKPETKDKVKEDLKKKFNELMAHAQKDKKDFVYEVIFYEWFCQ